MPKELKIELAEKTPDGIYVFKLVGSLAVEGAAGIQGLFDVCVREKVYRIVLDLAAVNFISSAGMGALLSSVGELRKNSGDMIFVKMQDKIMGVFKNLDVLDYFIVADDVDHAVERFRSGKLPRPPSLEELTAAAALPPVFEEAGQTRALFSLIAAYADIFDGDAELSHKFSQVVDITANYLALKQCAFIPLADELTPAATAAGGDVPPPTPTVIKVLTKALRGKEMVAVEQFRGLNKEVAAWFAHSGARFLLPLGSAPSPVALFVVSDKRDGEPISADEKRILRYLRTSFNLALRTFALERAATVAPETEQEFERKHMELETLFAFARELTGAGDTGEMLPTFLMMVTGQFGTNRALALLEDTRGDFAASATRGLGTDDLSRFTLPPVGVAAALGAAGGPTTTSELALVLDEAHRSQLKPFTDEGLALLAPMRFKKRVVGIVALGGKISGHDFDENEFRLLAALADLAAVSIESSQVLEKIKHVYSGVTRALISAIEAKDKFTRGHTERVTRYAAALAGELGLDEDDNQNLLFGAVLHDIGYIGVSEEALRMPNGISEEQLNEIRRHPTIGTHILKDIPFLEPALAGVRHHHEHFDGSGYPDGLAGEEIPLIARIIAVADAFDAMTSERRYRDAKTLKEAVGEIKKTRGVQFDPVIADAFIGLLDKGRLKIIKSKT